MSKLNYHGKIVVLKRDYPVSEIIDSIINMPCHEVRGFFQKIGLTVPKALRMKVLKEVLQEPVEKTIEERLNLADELGYRLSYFDRFSEYQLENLLKFYNSVSLNRKYLTELWLHLFMYMMEHKVSEKEIDLLIQDAKKHSEITEDILAYNFELRKVFHDEKIISMAYQLMILELFYTMHQRLMKLEILVRNMMLMFQEDLKKNN